MNVRSVIVSDHALVRYLERVLGIDVEAARQTIARTAAPAIAMGASSMSSDGFTFHIRDNRVTTIVPGKSPHYARLKTAMHKGGIRRIHRPEGRR